jgi:Yip1-like protein
MAVSPNLVARATNILKQPAVEWPVIATEPTDTATLMQGYAAPLAAIPAICRWIGYAFIGFGVPYFGTYRVGIVRGFANAVVSWVLALVGAYIAALIIEKLAPSFQSSGGTIQALKIVVYASTPVWVAGVLELVPALSPLIVIAALYAIYLFYLGLPEVMHTPGEQVIPYMIVSALVVIVVTLCLAVVTGVIAGVGGGYAF